jgi:hypothetical protein
MNYQNLRTPSYPGQLQAISIVQTVIGGLGIIGGITGGLVVLFMGIMTMGIGLIFIPIPFIYLVVGILSLIAGIKGLQKNTSYGLSLGHDYLWLRINGLNPASTTGSKKLFGKINQLKTRSKTLSTFRK